MIKVIVNTGRDRNILVELRGEDPIIKVKEEIMSKEGIPVQDQKYLYLGTELEDQNSLNHYQIQDDSTIHLLLNSEKLKQIYVSLMGSRSRSSSLTSSSPPPSPLLSSSPFSSLSSSYSSLPSPLSSSPLSLSATFLESASPSPSHSTSPRASSPRDTSPRGSSSFVSLSSSPCSTPSTPCDRLIPLVVDESETIQSIKNRIFERTKESLWSPNTRVIAIFGCRELDDSRPLKDYNLNNEEIIHLVQLQDIH